jgi:hypothetical protein
MAQYGDHISGVNTEIEVFQDLWPVPVIPEVDSLEAYQRRLRL